MNGNVCFVDTSAFIALNVPQDKNHREALQIAKQLNGYTFVLSDSVINETYTLLRYKVGFHTARRFLEDVLDVKAFYIVDITLSQRLLALNILEKFSDQKISYCDALSVAIMRDKSIDQIFAFDYHFELMGVKRIYVNNGY